MKQSERNRRAELRQRAHCARADAVQMSRRKRDRRTSPPGASASRGSATVDTIDGTAGGESILRDLKNDRTLWKAAAICVTACLALLFVEFVGRPVAFQYFLPQYGKLFDSYWPLRAKAWWIGCTIIGYVVFPAVVMSVSRGVRLGDCNLGWRGFAEHWRIYAGLYALVLPVIWIVSLSPDFYTFYPMYSDAGRSWFDLLSWEGMYLAQFIALEFFFRGFLVGGLSKYIGALAVPVSVMPYMMIHFSKLWPEATASIVAGLVLGYLAWKTKSIWGGVCVHCGVAMTMDLLALAHKGQLPWLRR